MRIAISLTIVLTLTQLATAQNDLTESEIQAIKADFKSSRPFTAIGVAQGNKCRIEFRGHVKPGARAIAGASISRLRFHDGICEMDYIIGEPTDSFLLEQQQRVRQLEQEPEQGRLQPAATYNFQDLRAKAEKLKSEMGLEKRTAELRPLIAGTSAVQARQWVRDPIRIEVNSTFTQLSWAWDAGGNIWQAWGSFIPGWFWQSGWGVTDEQRIYDITGSNQAFAQYHALFVNSVFCPLALGGGATFVDHFNNLYGYNDGQYGYGISAEFNGGCTNLLEHKWYVKCEGGACFGTPCAGNGCIP